MAYSRQGSLLLLWGSTSPWAGGSWVIKTTLSRWCLCFVPASVCWMDCLLMVGFLTNWHISCGSSLLWKAKPSPRGSGNASTKYALLITQLSLLVFVLWHWFLWNVHMPFCDCTETGESLPSLVAILPLFLRANGFVGDSLLNLPVGKVKCCKSKRIQGLLSLWCEWRLYIVFRRI